MTRHYHQWLEKQVAEQKIRLALFPFEDGIESDETFQKLFPLTLYDYLKRSRKAGILHPFLTFKAVVSEGAALPPQLFAEQTAIEKSKGLSATHALIGMFQKQPGNEVRFFIKVISLKDGKNLGPILEFTSEQGNRFFGLMAEVANAILAHLTGEKINFSSLVSNPPNFEAYRYFVKGMEKSDAYHETNLMVAKVWFEKAMSASFHFKKAASESARALFMLSLLQKQAAKNSSLFFQEANELLSTSGSYGLENHRWLQGYLAFTSGVGYFQGGQFKKAQTELEKAVLLLPEDGVAHEYLSQTNGRLGSVKAEKERALARELGTCEL